MATSHPRLPAPDAPRSPPATIPIAQMRSVYRCADIERRLNKLPPKEHESLRCTYERMLEMGSERFQVKPSGIPAMDHPSQSRRRFRENAGATAPACDPSAIHFNSPPRSAAFCQRSSGSFASDFFTTWSSAGGDIGWTCEIAGGEM